MLECEHLDCEERSPDVLEYVRLPADLLRDEEGLLTDEEKEDWKDEPIALCRKHSFGRELASD